MAFERYRFIEQMEADSRARFHWCMPGDYRATLLFPFASSERSYGIIQGAAGDYVTCWQRRNRRYTCLYVVRFDMRDATPDEMAKHKIESQVGSIEDWLYGNGETHNGIPQRYVPKSAAVYARNDMALKRQYIEWSGAWFGISIAYAFGTQKGVSEAHYGTLRDPLTGSKLKQDDFYRRYGLPLMREEIAAVRRKDTRDFRFHRHANRVKR